MARAPRHPSVDRSATQASRPEDVSRHRMDARRARRPGPTDSVQEARSRVHFGSPPTTVFGGFEALGDHTELQALAAAAGLGLVRIDIHSVVDLCPGSRSLTVPAGRSARSPR